MKTDSQPKETQEEIDAKNDQKERANKSLDILATGLRERCFDLKEALDDVRYSSGAKDTAISSATLAGKTLANAGLITLSHAIKNRKSIADNLKKQLDEAKKRNQEK